MISLTINGKLIKVKAPIKILEAARGHGIEIPTMCYYPKVESFGGCRMCLVEVGGSRRLQASCSLNAEDGMVVETETPEIHAVRKAMLEFMLINHPLDCPTCDKAGECDLQDFSVLYGAAAGRFKERKRTEPESVKDPLIVRNMERCIMCTKCVRACAELQGASAIDVIGRGKHTAIEPFSGAGFDCEYCGICIIACPVGSLMSKLHRHSYRPWDTESQTDSACPFCGLGCGIHLQMRETGMQRVIPAESDVNQGILCARGFFGYEYIENPKRLTTPLIRKNGKLTPASWEEAIGLIAEKFMHSRDVHGGLAVAAIASPKCTLEENYLLQKIMRAGLGSNNIDSISRLGLAGLRRIVEGLLGTRQTISETKRMAGSGAVLAVCSDPVTEAPVLGVRVRNAYDSGATVITLGHTPGLRRHSSISHVPPHGTEGHVLGALLRAVLEIKQPEGGNEIMQEVLKKLKLPTLKEADILIPSDEIRRSARALVDAGSVSLIAGRGLAGLQSSPWAVVVFAALAYTLDANVYLVSEGANEHGLIDMGCEPDALPGPALLTDIESKNLLEDLWDAKIPDEPGLSLMEIFEAAHTGDIKCLYVMGENPAFNLPDSRFVTEALKKLDFLVVQDIFTNETTHLADVILPAMAWAERDGIYLNMERRLQRIDAVVEGKGKEDWRILAELAEALGMDARYNASSDIFSEISQLLPLYKGLSPSNIKGKNSRWPYLQEGQNTASRLEPDTIAPYLDVPPVPHIPEVSFVIEKSLFNCGTTTRHSDALQGISSRPQAGMNHRLASRLGIIQGDPVKLVFAHGEVCLHAVLNQYLPENTVVISNQNKSTGINNLLGYNRLPFTNTPYIYTNNIGINKG